MQARTAADIVPAKPGAPGKSNADAYYGGPELRSDIYSICQTAGVPLTVAEITARSRVATRLHEATKHQEAAVRSQIKYIRKNTNKLGETVLPTKSGKGTGCLAYYWTGLKG